MELLNERDKLGQEAPEKTHLGSFQNVDLLEGQQRTKAEEFKDVKDTENMEMAIKDDSMTSSSKRSHASGSTHFLKKQRNEKVKPVQEGCNVPPSQSNHVGEFQNLENQDKEEKEVIQVRKGPSSKRADVDESKEEDVFKVKEKPVQMYCMDPSAEICAVKCKDGMNLEMKGEHAQEDIEVRAPQDDIVGKFKDKEQSIKEKLSTKINNLDVSQEIHIEDFTSAKSDVVCGGNLLTVQPSGSKSKGVSQEEDRNADEDCEAQESTDLFAKKDRLNVKDADSTMDLDLELGSDPNQLVSMTRDLDAVKDSYFTDAPCQTLLDQNEGNCVLDLEFGACNPLAHLHDNMVPQTCIRQCRVQAPLLKLSPHVTQDKNTLRNLQFKLLRAKGSSMADQKAIREIPTRAPIEMKNIDATENSTKEVMVSSADEHNGKSTDRQEMHPSKNCSSPKNNKTTVFEAGMGSSGKIECDLKQAKEDLKKTLCPEISGLPSTLQVTEKAEAIVLDREGGKQCPTPTMDEEPFVACSDLTSSNSGSCVTYLIGDKNYGKIFPVCPVKSSALMENRMPVRQQQNSGDIKDRDCLHHTHTDTELKIQGVVQSTDKNRSVSRDEDLRLFSGNVDNKIDKSIEIPDQNCASLEVYPNSRRPVMAVKPSKDDQIQVSCDYQQSLSESHLKSNDSEGKPPIPASIPLNKNMEEDMQETSTGTTPCSLLSGAGVSMCATGTKFHLPRDPLHLHKKNEISNSSKILSSQSSKCEGDTQQKSQTASENLELEKKSCSLASSSSVVDSAVGGMEYGFVLEPQNSLACTIFNTNNDRPESLLETLSKRCIQADPTQASIEQECLIFSEQMKQLIKRAKSGPIHQLEAHCQKNMFCPSPVIVRFSDLEEVETDVGHFDEPSFLLPKIKVDISDGKTLADTTGRETTPCPQEECSEPVAHTSVSEVTDECARLYTSMMNDVCGVSKAPLRSNYLKVDKVLSRTQPSNHFYFCDQMKKEVDHNFCNGMNSVVRKFCKTKYKFFILATSKDVFFEKTKVRYIFNKLQVHIALNLQWLSESETCLLFYTGHLFWCQ